MRTARRSGEGAGDPLVEAARKGDARALAAIWSRHAPAVLGYLRGRGAAEPEDLTSEVFLAVFERIGRFRGDDSDLRAFIFTVAHHRLVDDHRRRARQSLPCQYDAEHDARESDSAEQTAISGLGTDRARQLIDALPSEQRDVMLLRIIGDLTLQQTADVLGKRVGAVKAAQHRACIRLRELLGEAVSL